MRTMVSTEASVVLPRPMGGPDVLPPGAKAGPWIVGEELGRGGMGTVYAVVHEEIGKRAALKVMHDFLGSGITAERIKLEARVVNRVGHPNIVDIFETGTLDDGRPYIVMEQLEGASLSTVTWKTKLLPDRVVEILFQICEALIAAHAAGVIHRDLKLDNVFLIPGHEGGHDHVKLLDWGIAKDISSDAHCTIDGQLVGTPQYLSPEQARGGELTPATDIYSLGVMAFELFLEQLPFEAETAAEIMTMHLRAQPPRPAEIWPDVPRELEHLLLSMLAKDPADRPSLETIAGSLLRVRDELDRRRDEPRRVAPRFTRFASAPPLAPLSRPGVRGRLQLTLGACAIAASALLFLVAHDSRGIAAPAARLAAPAARLATPVTARPQLRPPAAIPAGAAAAGSGSAIADRREPARDSQAGRALGAARIEAPAPAEAASKPAPAHHHDASRHHGARLHHAHGAAGAASVTARRAISRFDPNGSVESY